MRKQSPKNAWLTWLDGYGTRNFLSAFLHNVEGAESKCVHCRLPIYVDILIGGGIPDWSTEDGDFGCDSVRSDGSHMPEKRREK